MTGERRLCYNTGEHCVGFANVKPGEVLVDIGTGTGVIPILLTKKGKGKYYFGIEIQEDMADMAARSVALNNLQEKVQIKIIKKYIIGILTSV